jgi:YVTN family beta-propeller protein
MNRQAIRSSTARAAVARGVQSPQISHTIVGGLVALTAAFLLAAGVSDALGDEVAAVQGPSGFVYTADEHGNSISAIDLATERVQTVSIAISPHNVQITADGDRLLAVGDPVAGGNTHGHGETGHDGEAAGQLLVFDPRKLESGPTASVEVGNHPAHVVVDQAGRRAFVTLAGQDAVAVVDLVRNEVSQTIATGRYPHGLRISPDGGTIYVANVEDGSVSVLDTETLAEVARIPVGKAPVQVGFTPNGSRVYVSLRDENSVAVIDTGTKEVIGRIAVGRNPIQVHATPDGRVVYVANQGTEAEPADTVSVIDVATGSIVETIRTGAGAHGVTVSGDGGFVFVSNIVDGTVSMIASDSRSVIRTFAVGRGPNGITFRSGGI